MTAPYSDTVRVQFKLDEDLLARLQAAADEDERSMAGTIRHALRLYLKGRER